MDLNLYTATSKCNRPNDDLIEAECARFKMSGADFGIITLTEINRWLTISPVVQFAIRKSKKEVDEDVERWKESIKDGVFATHTKDSHLSEKPPKEILDLITGIKEKVPDNFPGRLPTVSLLDEKGGFWTSTESRSPSSMISIFCPTVRFDLQPPELYYQLGDHTTINSIPSKDAATHAYYFAGLDFLKTIITVPIRVRKKEDISMITDGNIPLNDLQVPDFILAQIEDGSMWTDREQPFVVAFGSANTTILSREPAQLLDLLQNDFFVNYEH